MNVVAQIGHNQPPEPTPFEASKEAIETLFDEATGWLDGEPIATQEQADDLQKLMRMIQAAAKEAEENRKAEAKPFDEGKAEVQARYNPLIQKDKGKADLAVATCKKALAPWLLKIEAENKAKAEEARRAADEAAAKAREAMQARDGANLQASADAEQAVKDAREAEAAARRADNAKASAKGAGRAVTMRDYYTPEVTDATLFARHVWTTHRTEMDAFLAGMAAKLVAGGTLVLPGVTVHHERRPV